MQNEMARPQPGRLLAYFAALESPFVRLSDVGTPSGCETTIAHPESMKTFIRTRSLPLLTALTLALPSHGALAGNGSASDAAAVALPLLAAGVSIYYDDRDGFWQLVKAEAATIAMTEALKVTVRETRPNGQDSRSFPSRHASVAFSAARFMQLRGGWEYGVPAYVVAAAVAADRVHLREHYTKDVVAGALLGIASSSYFTDKPYRVSVGYMPGDRSILAELRMDW